MTTAPLTTPPVTILPTWVHTYTAFIKAHEKLFILLLTAGILFHYGEKGFSAWENYDKRRATLAQQQIDVDKTNNAQVQKQLDAIKAQADAATQIAQAAIVTAHKAAQQHKETDKTLPLPDLAIRWSVLTKEPTTEFTVTPDNKIAVSPEASHATVNQLEDIPDLNTTIGGLTTELSACNNVRTQQDTALAGAQKELKDTQTARKDDAATAKLEATHQYWRGFKHGFIAGVVTTVAATVAILK